MIVSHSKSVSMPMPGIESSEDTAGLFLADFGTKAPCEEAGVAKSDLSITVKNGVATLSGVTDTTAEANMVEYLVSRINGVREVINLINLDPAAYPCADSATLTA